MNTKDRAKTTGSAHPNRATLEQFGLGCLDDVGCEEVEVHLADCPDCCELLGKIARQEEDPFLNRLRVAADSFSGEGNSEPSQSGILKKTSMIPDRIGRFEIQETIGQGGFGVVLLANDPNLHRDVAIKIPRTGSFLTDAMRERFLRESQAAAALDHPNIVAIHEAGEVSGICFIASAYCNGPNLASWLKNQEKPVPFRTAALLLVDLAKGVQHAHSRGVLHRDLKPSNILLEPLSDEASSHTPKITDFGLAKLTDHDDVTKTNIVMGTAAYMAPEQASGSAKNVGPQSDVYSLGAILYEMLTGRPPIVGDSELETIQRIQSEEAISPTRLRPKLHRDLETICLTCLHKEPRHRYATAEALAADLQSFLRGEPIQARPVGRAGKLIRWCRRNPVIAATAGLAISAIVTAVALSIALAIQQSSAAARLLAEQQITKSALADSERMSAELAFDRANRLMNEGDVGDGLHWLAKALSIAPDSEEDLESAILWNLAAWHRMEFQPVWTSQQPGHIVDLKFDPGSERLASVGLLPNWEGFNLQLRDADQGSVIAEQSTELGGARQICFSPDGSKIYVSSYYGEDLRLFDSRDLSDSSFKESITVYGASFSNDGKRILAVGADSCWLRDVESGEILHSVDLPLEDIALAVIGPEQKVIAALERNSSSIHFLDPVSGDFVAEQMDHPNRVYAMAFSPDGKYLATGCFDGKLRIWNWQSATPGYEDFHDIEFKYAVNAVAFSNDGRYLVSGSTGVQIWDIESGEAVGKRIPRFVENVTDVEFSNDGKKVAIGSNNGEIRVWSLAAEPEVFRVTHQGGVQAVSFSSDGRYFLTAGFDGKARVWDASTNESVGNAISDDDAIHAAVFSPNGKLVLTGGADNTARLWETATGIPRGEPIPLDGAILPSNIQFSPNGEYFVTATETGTAQVWNTHTLQSVGKPMAHPNEILCVAFSPDGERIYTGTSLPDQSIRVWNSSSGEPLLDPIRLDGPVSDFSFSPAGNRLAVASKDVVLLDAVSLEQLVPGMKHQNRTRAVAFSPNGMYVASASFDGTSRIWNTATGEPVCQPLLHDEQVRELAFDPQGSLLATVSFDGTARVWHVPTGRPVGPVLHHHDDWVVALAFSPDGKSLLTGSTDGTARVWRIPTRPVVNDLKRIRLWTELIDQSELDDSGIVRNLSFEEWQDRKSKLTELGGPPLKE